MRKAVPKLLFAWSTILRNLWSLFDFRRTWTTASGAKVVEVRNETRNQSGHFVREPTDPQKFYDAATSALATGIKYLFDNH